MGKSKLRMLGKVEHFPWAEKLHKNEWPARELLWIWCHPMLSFVIFFTAVGTIILYISGA
jgi:hypothetical protein